MAEGSVLFVCTGNQCRSPMAEAFLRHRLSGRCPIEVASAGTVGDGTPPPDHAVTVMAERGLDVAGRPSRPLVADELSAADLIVTMSRQQLVDVATACPQAWDRAFTFTDLLDRAASAGGPVASETLSQWARRMSAGRTRASVLSAGSAGDIPDPIGGSVRDFERARDTLAALVDRLAAILCPAAAPSAPTSGPAPSSSPPAPPPEPSRRSRWRRRP